MATIALDLGMPEISDEAAVAAHPEPVLLLAEPSKRIRAASDAAVAQYGYPRETLLRMTIFELSPEEDIRALRDHWAGPGRALSSDGLWCHRRGDGSVIDVEMVSYYGEFGGQPGRLLLVRDVTKRRRAAEKNRRLVDALDERLHVNGLQVEAMRREIETIRLGLAHSLRNRLDSIERLHSHAQRECARALDSAGAECMEKLGTCVRQAGTFVDDVLCLSGIDRKRLARKRVDLSELAAGIMARLAQSHPERRVETSIEPNLTTYADPALLKRLLEVLIGNGWKHTSRRDPAGIAVGATRTRSDVVFHVRDNGEGFDTADADRLFEAFHVMSGRAEIEGSGLSLAIARRIVARHGGRIWADGCRDVGATFYFTLPERRRVAAVIERRGGASRSAL